MNDEKVVTNKMKRERAARESQYMIDLTELILKKNSSRERYSFNCLATASYKLFADNRLVTNNKNIIWRRHNPAKNVSVSRRLRLPLVPSKAITFYFKKFAH